MYRKPVICCILLILICHYGIIVGAARDKQNKVDSIIVRHAEPLPKPLIQPLDNFFTYSLKVTLSKQCKDECCRKAEIIYTLDGTDPGTSATAAAYEKMFTISNSTTVKAFLKAPDTCKTDSDVSEKTFVKMEPLPLPAAAPKESRVVFGQEISIYVPGFEHDTMVQIFYTLDGNDPATAGIKYNGPFGLHKSCILRTLAIYKSGIYLNSPIFYAKYTCSIALSPEPKATPPSTNFIDDISVSLSVPGYDDDDDMVIYYTIDGSEPTITGRIYKRPVKLTMTTELKAIGVKSGLRPSGIVGELYAKGSQPVVPKAQVVPEGGIYGEGIPPVRFKHQAEKVMVMYTLDGSEPTMASELWQGKPVNISEPATLKVKVFKTDWIPSITVTEKYDYENLPEPVPDFPSGTVFPDTLKVTLTVPGFMYEPGLKILYTLDGHDPRKTGKLYSGGIVLRESCIIKAFAQKNAYYDSNIGTYEYFNMKRVIRAYYRDNDRDGKIETAVVCFNNRVAIPPSLIEFTDPVTLTKKKVSANTISFSIDKQNNCLIFKFDEPFVCEGGFPSGHYGRIPLPGEFDTSPFLIHDSTKSSAPSSKNTPEADNSGMQTIKGNIEVINNPFNAGESILPKHIQSLNDFRTETGVSVSIKPKYPSTGYADIFDRLGNQVVFRNELIEDPATGALYLVWDGKDSKGTIVESGEYVVVIAIEERQSGKISSKKVNIVVKK